MNPPTTRNPGWLIARSDRDLAGATGTTLDLDLLARATERTGHRVLEGERRALGVLLTPLAVLDGLAARVVGLAVDVDGAPLLLRDAVGAQIELAAVLGGDADDGHLFSFGE